MSKTHVVVISSVTGGGKTTLIDHLLTHTLHSTKLSFDDYSIDALPSAPPIDTPVKDAVNQYDITEMLHDLLPLEGHYETVYLDFPFGYKHQALFPHIDKVIYLKTPLDICLARQIRRDYADQPAAEILAWAKTYLEFARPIFIDHETYVSEDADLLLDGTLSLEEQALAVKACLAIT